MTTNFSLPNFQEVLTSRFCKDHLSVVAEYTTAHCTEALFFDGRLYGIAAGTLRGYRGLFAKLPPLFSGTVLVPEALAPVSLPRRKTTLLSVQDGVAALAVQPVPAQKYPFAAVDGKKNPVYADYKEAETLSHRKRDGIFILEESRLIQRAVNDNLDIKHILYSNKSKLIQDGTLKAAAERNIPCFPVSEGLLSSVTSTRPAPAELAYCLLPGFGLKDISLYVDSTLLIADNIENPDNLGLILRTADACGADAVLCIGSQASIYHKNCVRAARGALGRMPILEYTPEELPALAAELKSLGYSLCGSSAKAAATVGNLEPHPRRAYIVSNETFGITEAMRAQCDEMLRIPMATGQSSLNVAVAAGILLSQA